MLSLPLNGHMLSGKMRKLTLLASVLLCFQPAAAEEPSFLFDSLVFSSGSTPLPIDSPGLSSSAQTAGQATELRVSYITPDLEFPFDYRVGVSFPPEFGFGANVSAVFGDNSPAPDPDLREIQIIDHTVIFRFRRTFFAPKAGQEGVITIRGVTLPTVAKAYDAAVFITDIDYVVLAGPGFTNEINVAPDVAVSVTISPDTPLTLQAGQSQAFSAIALDQYSNLIDREALSWSFDQNGETLGELTPGLLFATKTGAGRVVVSAGSISASSGLITVRPGPLDRLELSLVTPVFTGGALCDTALVFAFDQFGNPKDDLDLVAEPLRLTVSDGTVSPDSISLSGPFPDGVVDLQAAAVMFSNFIGVTTLTASVGVVQSLPINLNIASVEVELATVFFSNLPIPANTWLSMNLKLRGSGGIVGCVDSIRIENSAFGPVTINYAPGLPPVTIPVIVSVDSAVIFDESANSIDVTTFSKLQIDDGGIVFVVPGDCSSVFTTRIPRIFSLDQPFPNAGPDTLLLGTRYNSYTGFGFSSPHGVTKVLRATLEAFNDTGWIQFGELKSAPAPYSDAANDLLEYSLSTPTFPVIAEGDHDLRIIMELTDGVFTYLDTATAANRVTFLRPFQLTPVVNSLSPSNTLPLEPISYFGNFDTPDDLSRVSAVQDAVFELFDSATVFSAPASVHIFVMVESYVQLISQPITLPAIFSESQLGARFIVRIVEYGVERVDTIAASPATVTVGPLNPLLISSSVALVPNAPHVNTDQQFTLVVEITNTSQVRVRDAVIRLSSNGSSVFAGEVSVGTLGAGQTQTLPIAVTAAAATNALELISISAHSGQSGQAQSTDVLTLIVERSASVRLEASLSPSSGSIAQIGRQLSLEYRVINEGDAELGDGQIAISAVGAGLNFSVTAPINKEKQTVQLGAPNREGGLTVNASLAQIPMDKNIGSAAALVRPGADSFVASLAVVASLTKVGASITLTEPAGILLGEVRRLVNIELSNSSIDKKANIEIESMRIYFREPSGALLAPADLLNLNQTVLLDDNNNVASGRLTIDSALQIFFAPNSLAPRSSALYHLNVQIDPSARIGAFEVSIPLDEIKVLVTDGIQSGQILSPEAPAGSPGVIEKTYILGAPAFASSFTPMNNPFDPSAGPNQYRFTLSADAEMELAIYTLTGDPVYRKIYAPGSAGGSSGVQLIFWDGRNDNGAIVRNGVYLLYLTNLTTGEKATLKQAILR